ncbi:hypothetical protein P280DRAFT_470252 [Massarina eburnea CBS 473.64]|uniref:MATE efflux family protein n=1 Tax=Massarina eburnea CBS 473.64 TaxID=1395130 RepID=A0A6A6RZL1_9PLEO|nr:hypothetical protein P280DRAFT_470252 [Massarina eburnea CBS 473.64]
MTSSSPSRGQHRYRYSMMSTPKHDTAVREVRSREGSMEEEQHQNAGEEHEPISWKKQVLVDVKLSWHRETYTGALAFNIATFILPALYSTLSKLWVARIDSSRVMTIDLYAYIGVVVEVVNEGLARASYLIIGDKSSRSFRERVQLTHTLILVQSILGFIISIGFLAGASTFVKGFVAVEIRDASVAYVRIQSFSALSLAIEYAVNASTRALDKPDVPLIISSLKFAINIVLDLILISNFHVRGIAPSIEMQAGIQLTCNLVAAFAGLGYFIYTTSFSRTAEVHRDASEFSLKPSLSALKVLIKPGFIFFLESVIRNALYLWLVHSIVSMHEDYATAWGVFVTIRWGLIMVPVQALEATTLTFIGHSWGHFVHTFPQSSKILATKRQLWDITRWAFYSIVIALMVEVPICLFMSFFGAERFAYYLSNSSTVAAIAAHMWRTVDWCYIFYAVSTQLAAILMATRPSWYLYQSFASNLIYVLPWVVVAQTGGMTPNNAWTYHGLVVGGSLVFSFFVILVWDGLWASNLCI